MITDRRTDGQTDGQMDVQNIPILQDFVPYRGRCPKKDRKSRLLLLRSPWQVLSNGHLVFNIEIFPHEVIANQSEKVGMSQIQQPPYSCVPWKGRNFLTKKDRKSWLLLIRSPWQVLSNGHLVFNIKIFPHKVIANQSEKFRMSQIQQPLLPRIFSEPIVKVANIVGRHARSFLEDKS